jgi:hypothetical protein
MYRWSRLVLTAKPCRNKAVLARGGRIETTRSMQSLVWRILVGLWSLGLEANPGMYNFEVWNAYALYLPYSVRWKMKPVKRAAL